MVTQRHVQPPASTDPAITTPAQVQQNAQEGTVYSRTANHHLAMVVHAHSLTAWMGAVMVVGAILLIRGIHSRMGIALVGGVR